jgi:hypothetical protein
LNFLRELLFLGVYKKRLQGAFQNSDAQTLSAIVNLKPVLLKSEDRLESMDFMNKLLEMLNQYGRKILQDLKSRKPEDKLITNEVITLEMAHVLHQLPFMHQEKLQNLTHIYGSISQTYYKINNISKANRYLNLVQALKGIEVKEMKMEQPKYVSATDKIDPNQVLSEKIPPKSHDFGFLISVFTALLLCTIFVITYLKNKPKSPVSNDIVIPYDLPPPAAAVPVISAEEKQKIIEKLKLEGKTVDFIFTKIEQQYREIDKQKNGWNDGDKIDLLLKNWENAHVLSENDAFLSARLSLILRTIDKKVKAPSKYLQGFKSVGLISNDEDEYLKSFKTKTFEADYFYQIALESLKSKAVYNLNHHSTELMDNTVLDFDNRYKGLHTSEFFELKQKIKADKLKHLKK